MISEGCNWREIVEKSKFIDAKADDGSWNLAIIEGSYKINQPIRVRYDGLKSNYAHPVDFEEEYVAPLRYHTRGYTGDRSHDCRDHFKYEEFQIAETITKLESFTSALKAIENIDPLDFTQFVRGEVFVLIDSLLTSNFAKKRHQRKEAKTKEIETILKLCEAYCNLYSEWLSILPDWYSIYVEALKIKSMYLTSPFASIVCAGPEFTETLNLFFRSSPRTRNWKQAFEEFHYRDSGYPNECFAHYIITKLKKIKVFEKIKKILEGPVPLELMLEILKSYVSFDHDDTKSIKDFLKSCCRKVMVKIGNITIKEMDELGKETLNDIHKLLIKFLTLEETNTECCKSSSVIIQFYMKMVESTNISIKAFALKSLPTLSKDKKLAKEVINALLKSKFIEEIFKERNDTVLKEAKDLIDFMISENKFTQSDLSIIWESFISCKEETTTKRILDVIIILSKSYGEDLLDMISSTPRAKSKVQGSLKKEQESHSASLQFLWKLIFELELSYNVKDIIMNSFITLLTNSNSDKEQYIHMAVVNFEQGVNVELSIEFLLKIKFTDLFIDKTTLEKFILDYKLINGCIDSMILFQDKARKKGSKEMNKEDLNLRVQASLHLTFLQEVSSVGKRCSLSDEQLNRIWDIYFLKSLIPDYRSILWGILRKKNKNKHIGFFNSLEEVKKFFISHLTNKENFPITELSFEAFECFKRYFEYLNTNHISRIKRYIGMDYLWHIALKCKNKIVQGSAEDFITDLYFQYMTKEECDSGDVEEFIEKAVSEKCENTEELSAGLSILNKLMSKADGGDYEQNFDLKAFEESPVHKLCFIKPDAEDHLTVSISKKLDTNDLLKYLSHHYKVPKERINLIVDEESVNKENISTLLSYGLINIEIKNSLLHESITLKYVLANSKDLIKKFLKLMNGQREDIVWDFLTKLPRSEYMKRKLLELPFNDSMNPNEFWRDCLEMENNNASTAYSLHGFISILCSEKLTNKEYLDKLHKAHCFEFIYTLFKENKEMRCKSYCITIMNMIWREESVKKGSEKLLWHAVMDVINWILKKEQKENKLGEMLELLDSCIYLQIKVYKLNETLFSDKITSELYETLLNFGILGENEAIRKAIKKMLNHIYMTIVRNSRSREELEVNIIKILSVSYSKSNSQPFIEFYELAEEILVKYSDESFALLDLKEFMLSIQNNIIKYSSDLNKNRILLNGDIVILRILLHQYRSSLSDFEKLLDTLSKLITVHNEAIRSNALSLFAELVKRMQKYSEIVDKLMSMQGNQNWRTEKPSDWHIVCEVPKELDIHYTGLINMGATCYVNSVIQQLFMLPEFSGDILRLEDTLKPSALYELQRVFAELQQNREQDFKAKDFYDSMEVDVKVQKDASEFLITLFERLNIFLRRTSEKRLIEDTFRLITEIKVTCSKCQVISEVSATYFLLELEVKGKRNIEEGLESLIGIETLKDDNAYFCKSCEEKVKAEKRERIKSLPSILFVHLKRFEMTYESEGRKINSYYEFPLELDLTKYSALDANDAECFAEAYKEYFMYNLKGVIIHVGTVHAGHYYSLIKDKYTKKWFKFNDTQITTFDINNLPNEAFGNRGEGNFNRSNNAYILIYERNTFLSKEIVVSIESKRITDVTIENIKKSKRKIHTRHTLKLSKQLTLEMDEKNRLIDDRNLVFNSGYAKFVIEMFDYCQLLSYDEYNKNEKVFFFGLNFLLTVLIRSGMTEQTLKLLKIVKDFCEKYKKVALNIIEAFSNPKIIQELLIYCPLITARKYTAELLITAIKSSHNIESQNIEIFIKERKGIVPSVVYLMDVLISQLNNLNRNLCIEYFGVLSEFMNLKTKDHFLNYSLVGPILKLLNIPNNVPSSLKSKVNCSKNVRNIIPISLSWNPIPEDKTINIEGAFPFIINFLAQLIKLQPNTKDITPLLKQENLRKLFNTATTKESAMAITELMKTLVKINEKVMIEIINSLKFYTNIELSELLITIKALLEVATDKVFKESMKKIYMEVRLELAKYYSVEYMTIVMYIDFIIELFTSNNRCKLEIINEEVQTLFKEIEQWLRKNEVINESMKLFRYFTVVLPEDSTEIISLSRGANKRRLDAIKNIQKEDMKLDGGVKENYHAKESPIKEQDIKEERRLLLQQYPTFKPLPSTNYLNLHFN